MVLCVMSNQVIDRLINNTHVKLSLYGRSYSREVEFVSQKLCKFYAHPAIHISSILWRHKHERRPLKIQSWYINWNVIAIFAALNIDHFFYLTMAKLQPICNKISCCKNRCRASYWCKLTNNRLKSIVWTSRFSLSLCLSLSLLYIFVHIRCSYRLIGKY